MPSAPHDEVIHQNDLLTVKEVADYLRVSRVTVWRWCHQGVIPAIRLGRTWRIRRRSLLCNLDPLDSEVELPSALADTMHR